LILAVAAKDAAIDAAWIAGSFLIGSIPFGLVIGRFFYRTDIRRSGSGNIGAMNALRALGKRAAAAVLLLDAAKGAIPAAVAFALAPPLQGPMHGFSLAFAAAASASAVLGHCFSPWLRFRGGKGVATWLGSLFVLSWPAALASAGGWIVGAGTTTYSSAGSMLGSVLAPFALWYFTHDVWLTGYGALAALLILYTHRENITRMRRGEEKGIPFIRRNRRPS
jgi:glycerol-3-phosphate acyltransferase PlsY